MAPNGARPRHSSKSSRIADLRRGADFPVCCIAGFQTRDVCKVACAADLEVGDTAAASDPAPFAFWANPARTSLSFRRHADAMARQAGRDGEGERGIRNATNPKSFPVPSNFGFCKVPNQGAWPQMYGKLEGATLA